MIRLSTGSVVKKSCLYSLMLLCNLKRINCLFCIVKCIHEKYEEKSHELHNDK